MEEKEAEGLMGRERLSEFFSCDCLKRRQPPSQGEGTENDTRWPEREAAGTLACGGVHWLSGFGKVEIFPELNTHVSVTQPLHCWLCCPHKNACLCQPRHPTYDHRGPCVRDRRWPLAAWQPWQGWAAGATWHCGCSVCLSFLVCTVRGSLREPPFLYQ